MQYDALIDALKASHWDRDDITAAASADPGAALAIALAILEQPPNGSSFLEAALGFVAADDYPAVVRAAIGHRADPDPARVKALRRVVETAALRAPHSLTPHLAALWDDNPCGPRYALWPWRAAGDDEIARLQQLAADEATPPDRRNAALRALLETRRPPVLRWVRERDPELARWDAPGVGFAFDDDEPRPLYPSRCFHLVFPPGYIRTLDADKALHPTWRPQGETITDARFGGAADGACSLCGKTLHHIITLTANLDALGVSGLDRLEIATCLSCLGWEDHERHYAHDAHGRPADIEEPGAPLTPQFPVGPLAEATCRITATAPGWLWQDWGQSNGRESLNRLGGHPCWVQDAQYPACKSCERTMSFLLQLDGDLSPADEDDGEFLWGSGGLGYAFWCDSCRRSALLWQCT